MDIHVRRVGQSLESVVFSDEESRILKDGGIDAAFLQADQHDRRCSDRHDLHVFNTHAPLAQDQQQRDMTGWAEACYPDSFSL